MMRVLMRVLLRVHLTPFILRDICRTLWLWCCKLFGNSRHLTAYLVVSIARENNKHSRNRYDGPIDFHFTPFRLDSIISYIPILLLYHIGLLDAREK